VHIGILAKIAWADHEQTLITVKQLSILHSIRNLGMTLFYLQECTSILEVLKVLHKGTST